MVMSLCVVPASAAGSGVTITITPNKSTVDTATGDAVVTYTVKAKVTDPSLKVGALTIILDPGAGLTLAEETKKKNPNFYYQANAAKYQYNEETNDTGIFETVFSYAPKTKTFVASGTTNDRNLNSTHGEIVLMTIMGKIAKGTTGSVTLGASTANYGDPSGEASSIVNCEVPPATVTITKAPISSVTASVETPVAGQPLDFTGTVDSGQPYSITKVEWFEGTNAIGTPVTGPATAKAKQYYYARITLTANPGETFAESLDNTVSGIYSVTRNSATELYLTKAYPATGSLPAATVTAAPTAKSGLEYNGTEQGLLGFVGTANGGTMQYSLDNATWSTAIPKGKDAKTYTVYYMVKGDSSHSDYTPTSNTVSVKIDPKDISGVTIGTIASQSYTGSAITPDPEVKDGATTLVKGTDYTVSCANTYVGTATLTITGKGNYTGTKDANFTITAVNQNPTFTTPKDLVKGGHKLDLRTLVQGAKGDMIFTITSGNAATLSGHELISTGITGVVKIKVSIAAKDMNGDTINEYNAFSKSEAITVNVVDKTINTTTMKVSQGDITYGGSVSPSVTNKPDGTGTVSYTYEGRDGTTYSSSATAPTNVGKYKVKATCESSTTIYTAEDTFEILAKSISGMTVTLNKTSLEYNGSAQTVTVTGVGSLTAADYTVTGTTSSTNVGNYTVTVTGKGNYKDTAKATWQITPATLTVTPNDSQSKKFNEADPALTYTYSGNASGQTPAFTGALNRAAGEDVGNYAIQLGTLALQDNGTFKATNYKLEFAATTVNFEIQKADFTGTAAKTVDILKNQTTAQSGTLTAADFFTGTAPAGAKITAVTSASATMMNNVSVDTVTGKLSYTSNTNIAATSNEAYTVTIATKNYNNISATLTFQPKSSGGSYVPTVQKPEITIIGSGKADLSADGRTATITANAGHELVSVVLNGKEMGKVEKLTGLKTGDKATITFQAKTDGKAEMDKMIAQKASKLTLMARSKKTAKLNIKVVVKGDLKAITDAGYTVKYKFYRSTKKSAGYKAVLTKKAPTYFNTYGKKGTMYYYKARVMIYDKEGNFVAQTALKQCKYANRLWTK